MPFFDQLKAQADKAQFEANKMMRVNAVQNEINGLRNQFQARRDELSGLVYEAFKAGQLTDPKLISVCEAMQTLDNAIVAKQRDIDAIKQERAPGAGPTPAQPPRPATPAPTSAVSAPAAASGTVYGHICPKENIQLPENVMFCPNCGSKAVDVPAPAPAAPAPVLSARPSTCPNCQAPLAPNVAFCPNCGAKITA